MSSKWSLSFSALAVDVFAWGGSEDLYSCRRARICVVEEGPSAYLCVVSPRAAEVVLLDLGRLLELTAYERPTSVTITYSVEERAGLTLTFPDERTLESFRHLTLLFDTPGASTSAAPSFRDLQDIGCVPKNNMAVAYGRSFVGHDVISWPCQFLFRATETTSDVSPPTPKPTASHISGVDSDWVDLALEVFGDDGKVLLDAVKPPKWHWHWFKINM